MKRKYVSIVLVLIALSLFQCQKNLSYTGSPDPGVPVNPSPITANVQGNITDENNNAASGVIVTAGTSTAVTDANGFFHITKASLDKNTTLITARKDGYFKAYRVFAATSGCNQVTIKLVKRNLAGTISSSSGGEVSLPDGSKIKLLASGIVNASSSSDYSGDVKVYASYINPTNHDIAQTVPGSFVANDKNGKRVLLSSYGMLAVELESSSGEKLQIKQGSVATLTIPIPTSAVASAPASIALWYIDEKTGIWQEEGTATKSGNTYVGTVKHFSYWNCDYSYDAVDLSFTLHTPNDLPLVNAYVEVVPIDSVGGLAHGYTDSLGQVKGLVPANKDLVLKVFSSCGVIYSKNIAAINQSTDLGTIKISGATSSLLTFAGTLLNCSGAPVTNGYALINFNGTTRYVATNASGQFTTTYVICSSAPATATVLGVDEDNQQQGAATTVNITSPSTDAGNITACGVSAEQFINYNVDGTNHSITSAANDSIVGTTYNVGTSSNETYIFGMHDNNVNNSITFTVDNLSAPGTYPITKLYVQSYNPVSLTQPFNVTFTSFASNVGEFYEGSFSGQFTDSLTTVHTVSSTFKVRRNF